MHPQPVVLLSIISMVLPACDAGTAKLRPVDARIGESLSVDSGAGDALAEDSREFPVYEGGVAPPSGWSETGPGTRSEAELCSAWISSTPVPGFVHDTAAECVPASLPSTGRSDAMTRLNFYRWLVGMPFALEATPYLDGLEACAFYHARNELDVSHDPPSNLACYSEIVSETSAVSNLASGVENPADAVDLFVSDVAHRALVLAPGLHATGFGFYDGVTCQLMFGDNWSWSPPTHRSIAYPAPGANPQSPTKLFTIHPATGHTFDTTTSVSIMRGGEELHPTVERHTTGYGTEILVATLAEEPERGVLHQVLVSGIATAAGRVEESYSVHFIACD